MPVLLPEPRWALTPPLHPYLLPGGIFSVALSVGKRVMQSDYNCHFPPGCYPAFFPVEPGLSSPKQFIIKLSGTIISFLCILIILNLSILKKNLLLHQNLHIPGFHPEKLLLHLHQRKAIQSQQEHQFLQEH